jgi:hypothetical protein
VFIFTHNLLHADKDKDTVTPLAFTSHHSLRCDIKHLVLNCVLAISLPVVRPASPQALALHMRWYAMPFHEMPRVAMAQCRSRLPRSVTTMSSDHVWALGVSDTDHVWLWVLVTQITCGSGWQ